MHLKAFISEILGTFAVLFIFFSAWLIVPGANASSWLPAAAMGFATTALTYGLGQISGGHFNPAITIGLVVGGRFDVIYAPLFLIAQLIGAITAAAVVFMLVDAPQGAGASGEGSFAQLANQFGREGTYAFPAAFLSEMILAGILVIVFFGVTSHHSLMPLAPVAIGLALTVCYLIAIPMTKAGLNPARSTAAALFAGVEYIGVLWIFWIAPITGACIGGLLARYLYDGYEDH